MRRPRPGAFTLIEMMIVIGIIGLLIGISMTALLAVRSQGKKITEKNEIRQVGNAWLQYAQIHRDRIAPGWLSPSTQSKWEMALTYPDGTLISPAPTYGSDQPNVAGPWTWRLLPYMDHDFRLVRGHVEDKTINHWVDVDEDLKLALAEQTAFGVNGYFLGGVWDRWYGHLSSTHPRFIKVQDVENRGVNLTTTSLSMLKNPGRILAFVTNAAGEPGQVSQRLDDDPGWWLATPHRLGDELQWKINTGLDLEMVDGVSAPIGRYGGPAITWHPDGHVDSFSLTELLDQRLWIDRADDVRGHAGSDYRYVEP